MSRGLIKLLVLSTFLVSLLGHFGVLGRLGIGNINIFDFYLFYINLILLIFLQLSKRIFIKFEFFIFLAFAFIAFLSLLINYNKFSVFELFFSSFYLFRFINLLVFGIFVYNFMEINVFDKRFVINLILLSGVLLGILGIVQLILLPDFTVLSAEFGYDPHKFRLASTFFDPNFTGAYLSIVLGFLFYYKKELSSYKFFILAIFLFLCILLTFSRSAWLFTSIVVMIYGVFRYRTLMILAVFIAFLAYFAVPRVQTRISGITDPADSARFRFISWNNTLEIFESSPIYGVGFNTFRFVQKDLGFFEVGSFGGNSGGGADSTFLLIFATTGIVGGLVFVFAYFYPIFSVFFRKNFVSFDIWILASALIIGLLLNSQFINSLLFPQILMLYFLFLAIFSFETS